MNLNDIYCCGRGKFKYRVSKVSVQGRTEYVKGIKADRKMGSGVSPEKKESPLTHIVRTERRL